MKTTAKFALLAIIAVMTVAPLIYVFANQLPLQQGFHGVGVLKTADPFAYIGDSVTYQIKVYNPSDFKLYKINVTDSMLKLNVIIPFMAAKNLTGLTYTLQRKVLQNDSNPLINTVSVKAVDDQGIYSTASTQAKTTIAQRWINITKTGPKFAHVGDAIKYTIVVKNVAKSPIANVTVNDEMLGFSWRGDLAVSESNVFNLTYVVPKGAPDPLTNTATVYAKPNQTTVYAESKWAVDILHPRLTVSKTAKPLEISAGRNVTFTIVVTNTGDAPLYNLTLVDSLYGNAPSKLVPSNVSAGASFKWAFNATMREGCVVNVATATGVDVLGKKVSASDKVFVTVKPMPKPPEPKPVAFPKSLGYWKNHPEAWPVEQIKVGNVTYSKRQALEILNGANAKDATRMLVAQLIIAKLNRLSGVPPSFKYQDKTLNIDSVFSDVEQFLKTHPFGSDPRGTARQEALQLKNMLDAYNNKGECE